MRPLITSLVLVALTTVAGAEEQKSPPGFRLLWNGTDLSGWNTIDSKESGWPIADGVLSVSHKPPGFPRLVTDAQYDDFDLRMDYRVSQGAIFTLTVRCVGVGGIEGGGVPLILQDDAAFAKARPENTTGAIRSLAAPTRSAGKAAGEWNRLQVLAVDRQLKVVLNGETVQDVNLDDLFEKHRGAGGLQRPGGRIGLSMYRGKADFRDLSIKPLNESSNVGRVTLTLDPGGHTARIGAGVFTADGKQLLTGSADGSVRFWDVQTGEQRRVLRVPGFGDRSRMALSPDGKTLAVASRYPEGNKLHDVVYLVNLADGTIEHTLRGHKESVLCVAFSADGKRLATSAEDHSIRIWDPASGKLSKVISTPIGWFGIEHARHKNRGELALSPTGERLIYTVPRKAVLLEVATGKVLADLPLKDKDFNGVSWSPDGKTIATSGDALWQGGEVIDSGFRLLDADGKPLKQPEEPKGSSSAAFGKDGRLVVSWGFQGVYHRATVLDPAPAKEVSTFAPTRSLVKDHNPPAFVAGAALSPDGKFGASFGGAGGLHEAFLWKTADGDLVHRLAARSWLRPGMTVYWSADGKRVAWNWRKNTPTTFDLNNLTIEPLTDGQTLKGPAVEEGALKLVVLEPGKRYWERQVVKDNEVISRLGVPHRGHKPDGATFVGPDRVAMSGDWGGFFLYDVASQKRIREYKDAAGVIGRDRVISSIAPSPDKGRLLATIGADQILRLWKTNEARPLLMLYVNGRDWVIWTEEGYYAATPGGEKMIGWVVDNGIDKTPSYYTADRFKKKLHRPDVIKKTFELGSVEKALASLDGKGAKVAELEQILPPRSVLRVLKLEKDEVTVEVKAQAQAKGQPVVALRLLLDGLPFPDLDAQEYDKPLTQAIWTQKVKLPPGKHTLAVLARSVDASARSEPVPVEWVAQANKPTLHVLAVGINDYKNGLDKLACATRDADDVSTAFKAVKAGGLFRDVVVHNPVKDASARVVKEQLAQLHKMVKRGDVVVVFLAGHGTVSKGDFYFLTTDSNPRELTEQNAVSGKKLSEQLRRLPCQVLLLLDACHSGAANLRAGSDEAARTFSDDEVGICVLSAAMGNQTARERNGNGLFTRALKEALTADKAELPRNYSDGRMYIRHLYAHVVDRVAFESGEKQTPFLRMPDGILPFAIRQLGKK